MRRTLKALALAGVLLLAMVWAIAPPAARHLSLERDRLLVRGAIHVHTTVSDGAGTPDEVAAAAARAGLDFVVLTDHGDGTRLPVPPRRVSGVLVIDAVEISTTGGHYLGFGLGQTPYRLAGEPRDVIEDVTRFGGFGIVAHPDSPKLELAWHEWQAPFQGLEWLNADSAWRDEPRSALVRTVASHWLRPAEAVASLFDRPSRTLARWDALARRRPVVAIAALDAHARLGPRGTWESPGRTYALRLPSYESAFKTFSLGVRLPSALSADASAAATAILSAIRAGHVFSVVDGFAGPASLEFVATHAGGRAQMGDTVPGTEAELLATLSPPVDGATLLLVKNGEVVERAAGTRLSFANSAGAPPAVYRVEVSLPGTPGTPPAPWIVGNHIRVGLAAAPATTPLLGMARWSRPAPQERWAVEQHAASMARLTSAILTPTNTAWTLTYELGGGAPSGQYAAIAVPVAPDLLRDADRLSFTARSAGPMRVSVQVRIPEGTGQRWQRSVYLSPSASVISIPLRELTPVEAPPGTPLDRRRVDTILFVVDTVNSVPGSAGEFSISELRVEG
jgi:hypothetical protein